MSHHVGAGPDTQGLVSTKDCSPSALHHTPALSTQNMLLLASHCQQTAEVGMSHAGHLEHMGMLGLQAKSHHGGSQELPLYGRLHSSAQQGSPRYRFPHKCLLKRFGS